MKHVLWCSVAVLSACEQLPTPPDAGADSGFDVDADMVVDAGIIEVARGCWPSSGHKFIVIFDSGSVCYHVSFRRPDSGVAPLFSNVTAPEDFFVDDARGGSCFNELEQANGSLDQRAPRLADFSADVSWNAFTTRPYSFNAAGSLVFSGYRYWFRTPPEGAGITDPCRGP